MNNIFLLYGATVLLVFTWATSEGYAFSSFFENHQHGGRGSSGVWIHSYHK